MKTFEDIQIWYANKLNKTVAEFDDYDNYIAKVVYMFYCEENNIS